MGLSRWGPVVWMDVDRTRGRLCDCGALDGCIRKSFAKTGRVIIALRVWWHMVLFHVCILTTRQCFICVYPLLILLSDSSVLLLYFVFIYIVHIFFLNGKT